MGKLPWTLILLLLSASASRSAEMVDVDLGLSPKSEGITVLDATGWSSETIRGIDALTFRPSVDGETGTIVLDVDDGFIHRGDVSPVWIAFEYSLESVSSRSEEAVLEVRADCYGRGEDNERRLVGRFRAPNANRWYLGSVRLTDAYFGGRLEGGTSKGDFALSVQGARCGVNRVWVLDHAPNAYLSAPLIPEVALGRIRGEIVLEDLKIPAGNLFVKIVSPAGDLCDVRVPYDGVFTAASLPSGTTQFEVYDTRFREIPTSSRKSRLNVEPSTEPKDLKLEIKADGISLGTCFQSSVDGGRQPMGLYLPWRFRQKEEHPLVVGLHGTRENELAFLDNLDLPLPVSIDKAVIVSPGGRGDSCFDGIAERDIFDAIQFLRERMGINPDQIYLVGYSAGASAAIRILTLRPGIFAGGMFIQPIIDRRLFPEVPPYVDPLLRTAFPFECLSNLVGTPTLWIHGEGDPRSPIDHSVRAVELIKNSGGVAELVTIQSSEKVWLPALGNRANLKWLLTQDRAPAPQTVRFMTPTVRYSDSYWVGIDQISGEIPFATIEVEIEDAENNQIGMYSRGVLACHLQTDAIPARLRDEIVLFVENQNPIAEKIPKNGRIDVKLAETPIGYAKTPDHVGPWKMAFCKPFIYVVGNQEEETILRKAMRLQAERRFFLPIGAIRQARLLTDEDKRSYNLICFGRPDSCPLFESVLRQTSFRMENGRVRVGSNWVGGDSLSLHLVYPSQFAADRLIQMNFAFDPEVLSDFSALRYHLPDYAILDNKGRADETGWDVPVAGWFSPQWEIRDEWMYVREDVSLR